MIFKEEAMRIAVIDGQGGGMGKVIIEKLRKEFREQIDILALGTNALATSAMLKAGANEGATGENAIAYNSKDVDFIIGSLSIIMANSMLGELTPKMAEVVTNSKAQKLLIPIYRGNIDIIGLKTEPLPHLVDALLLQVKKYLGGEKTCVKLTFMS
jgi:NAD(P)-dependent dehydrogenase (short-subunit alcohol dehydrogenase family)